MSEARRFSEKSVRLLVFGLAIWKQISNVGMKLTAPLSTAERCLHFELNKLVHPPPFNLHR